MPSENVHAALKALEGINNPSFDCALEFLHKARESKARLPEQYYKYGSYVLQKYSGRLALDELWNLREEVAVAALQVGKADVATDMAEQIQRQFPGSSRVSRLLGMLFEATNNHSKAQDIYKKEMETDSANAMISKRLVALKEGQGDIAGAIQELQNYLKIHMTDVAAWEHAAELYLKIAAYSQAIFCLEEVLLHQPGNISAQLLLADALYAAGGTANWEAARGYYSGLTEITGGENTRALYGLCACTAQLSGGRQRGGSSTESGELGQLAGEALRQKYAVQNADKLPLVDAMLRTEGVL